MGIEYHDDEFSYQLRLTGPLWQSGGAAVTGGIYAPGGTVSSVAAALATEWLWMTAWLSDECAISSVYVASEIQSTEVSITGGEGERTSTSASPNTAPIVSLKSTGGKGPRFRGRWFLPGILSEAGLADDGTLDPDFRSDISVAIETMLENLVADEFFPTILSRSGGVTPVPSNPVAVNSFTVRDRAGTQRRRLRR